MTAGRRGMVLMVVFVVLWAAVEALAGGVLRKYSPYQVVFTRYVVHMVLMLAVWGWRRPASLVRTRRPVYQLARSMLMLGMPASWIIATQQGVEIGTTMSVFWLSPLLIMGFAGAILGERAPLRVWIAAVIACAGAMALTRPGALPPPLMLVFPVGMAATFSLYAVMTRSLRTESTRSNLFYSAFGVAVALVPVMARVWVTPEARDLLVMVGVGVLGFVTLWALDRAAAAGPISLSAPLAFLQLPFFIGIDWALGHEHLGKRAVLGIALIAASATYLWTQEPRIRVKEPSSS